MLEPQANTVPFERRCFRGCGREAVVILEDALRLCASCCLGELSRYEAQWLGIAKAA